MGIQLQLTICEQFDWRFEFWVELLDHLGRPSIGHLLDGSK